MLRTAGKIAAVVEDESREGESSDHPAGELVERDRSGVGDVQALHAFVNRDADHQVAMLAGEAAQAFAFGAKHEGYFAREIGFVDRGLRVGIEAHAPEPRLLEPAEGAREVHDADEGNAL